MSAFVLEPEQLNKLVAFFKNEQSLHLSMVGSVIKRYMADHPSKLPWNDLLTGMYNMNVDAVNALYHESGGYRSFCHKSVFPYTRMQAFQALDCFLYQCSEGDVPTYPLFLFLREVLIALMREIIYALPAYEKSTWR